MSPGSPRPAFGGARRPARPAITVAGLVGLVLAACGGEPAATGGDDTPDPAVHEGYLTGAGGTRLHFRVLGSAPDTVVVVHGGPGAGIGSVLPDFRPLAESFTVVFYDQRGGGRSELPADTASLHARHFVEDLEAVRRHFGLERMKVITHSFGSILVARYARRYPERLERVVLHGATGPERSRAAELARASPPATDTALADSASALLRALLRGEASDPVATCREYEAIGRRLASLRGEEPAWRGSTCDAPAEAVAYYYRHTARFAPRTFGAWDFTRGGLDELRAPVLVVYGARDSLAVDQQRAWAAAVPEGRLLLVPDAGKGAIAQRPDVVLPAVTAFMGGRWPEDAEEVEPRGGEPDGRG